MYRSLFAGFAATLVLCAAPAAAPVQATSAILRCQSTDGSLVYTDKACSAFGGRSLPISAELLARIARDEARNADATIDPGMPGSVAALPISRRSASSGCARTPTQLAMDLRGSLALGDVNRVAESYHWVGMSSRQGERTLDRLQGLTGKTVVDSHYFDAQISMSPSLSAMPDASLLAASDASGIGGDAGMLQLVLGDDAARSATQSVIDLDVHKYAGCYFVTF
jgi:hypothetical protein